MSGEVVAALEAATKGSRKLDRMVSDAIGAAHGDFADPRYTTSLDAAQTLVPDGWFPLLDWWGPHVRLRPLDDAGLHHGIGVGHRDIRIALCIAALRARADAAPQGGGGSRG